MAALDWIDVEHMPVWESLAEPASEVPRITVIRSKRRMFGALGSLRRRRL